MFLIGKILKPHGIKGEVKVLPATDDPSRFELLDKASVEFENLPEPLTLDIERVRTNNRFVTLKFKGVNSMDEAERLRGGRIIIADQDALPLERDEYYARDLYEMDVVTDMGEYLGKIADVLETRANDIYVVRPVEGRDILIPAVKRYIISVDVGAGLMTVDLAEGMR
ncbi:MAG: ribosome maturation factor RimM [Clostridiales bacterium]|jgi:16S rRNA processing protein RimM|nr:ribosome maturation factor RimM [Clostridiales bacterium]